MCLKQTLSLTMVPVIPTGSIYPEEVDRVKEILATEATGIAVTIAETTQSLNIHLKEI